MAEPQQPALETAFLAVSAGIASQFGFFLVPIAVKHGRALKLFVAALMLPYAVVLAASLLEVGSRALRGTPMEPWISATYVAGCAGYALGYSLLASKGQPAVNRSPTPASAQ
jgi:hypothetical protein